MASRAISITMFRKSCQLSVRQAEAALKMGQALDLNEVENAAEAVARREEQFIYYSEGKFGIEGLLSAEQRCESPSEDWTQFERVLDDMLGAVNRLEVAGYRGP